MIARRTVGRLTVASLALAALGLTAVGCSDDGDGSSGDLRQQVLTALANEVMVPAYQQVAAGSLTLLDDVRAACTTTGDAVALDAARSSWSTLRTSWNETRSFRFGPATTERTMNVIDYPIDPAKIDKLLGEQQAFTTTSLAALGADQRGLGGIEHVLYRTGDLDAQACSYATAATEIVADATARVLTGWTTGLDGARSFADQLIHPGDGGMYATEHDAYGDLVNSMIFTITVTADARIGRASGDATGTPEPTEADPGRAQRAKQDAIDTIRGVQAVYAGGPGGGLQQVVASISTDTATKMGTELEAAIAALDALPQPIATTIDPAPAHAAYEALKATVVTLRAEIASQLGITLTFGDADGDS